MRIAISAVLLLLAVNRPAVEAGVISAAPSTYRSLLGTLNPGDTLSLGPGTYPFFPLGGLNGTPQAWITVQGPATGAPAVISVDRNNPGCFNLIQLDTGSYRVLVENCTFASQGSDQGTIAISTTGFAWNWMIRGNTIIEAPSSPQMLRLLP